MKAARTVASRAVVMAEQRDDRLAAHLAEKWVWRKAEQLVALKVVSWVERKDDWMAEK